MLLILILIYIKNTQKITRKQSTKKKTFFQFTTQNLLSSLLCDYLLKKDDSFTDNFYVFERNFWSLELWTMYEKEKLVAMILYYYLLVSMWFAFNFQLSSVTNKPTGISIFLFLFYFCYMWFEWVSMLYWNIFFFCGDSELNSICFLVSLALSFFLRCKILKCLRLIFFCMNIYGLSVLVEEFFQSKIV